MSFIYDMVDTWNAAGTTFTAIKMNVTNTASAAGSMLIDLQVSAASKFNVNKGGFININSSVSVDAVTLGNAGGANFPGIWFGANALSPDFTNYSFLYDAPSSATILNGPTQIQFRIANQKLGIIGAAEYRLASGMVSGWSSNSDATGAPNDTGFSRIGAADVALGNGTVSDATGNLRVGSLRVNQTPTANTSAATTITNGADSATNLGHRAQFSMNGTAYWFPCGATAF